MCDVSVLVTGSCGRISSEVSVFFAHQGFRVIGIDDNHRAVFFGPGADTSWAFDLLYGEIPNRRHESIDIRDRDATLRIVKETRPNRIIQTAAQPSHDRRRRDSVLDFEVNAPGTLDMLEAARQFRAETRFNNMSTN